MVVDGLGCRSAQTFPLLPRNRRRLRGGGHDPALRAQPACPARQRPGRRTRQRSGVGARGAWQSQHARARLPFHQQSASGAAPVQRSGPATRRHRQRSCRARGCTSSAFTARWCPTRSFGPGGAVGAGRARRLNTTRCVRAELSLAPSGLTGLQPVAGQVAPPRPKGRLRPRRIPGPFQSGRLARVNPHKAPPTGHCGWVHPRSTGQRWLQNQSPCPARPAPCKAETWARKMAFELIACAHHRKRPRSGDSAQLPSN